MAKIELANQQFVRADLEEGDIDMSYAVDSFMVCIVPNDTCKYNVIKNIGQEISKEIQNEFRQLKENDVIIFKKIFVKASDGTSVELMPVMITIYK